MSIDSIDLSTPAETILDLMGEIDRATLTRDLAIERLNNQILSPVGNLDSALPLSSRMIEVINPQELNQEELRCFLSGIRVLCQEEGIEPFREILKGFLETDRLEAAKYTLDFILSTEVSKKNIEDCLSEIFAGACINNNLVLAQNVYKLAESSKWQVIPDINYKLFGNSPLHSAAANGSAELLKFILDKKGADLELKTNRGLETPLYFAIEQGNIECVALLLAAGANPNARDRENNTPLHKASLAYQNQQISADATDRIANALLAHQANPTLKNKAGFTPNAIKNGLISGTSLERLLSNANGLSNVNKKSEQRIYEGLHPSYPILMD